VVRIGWLYRQALHTYRSRFPIVASVAVIVFVPLALLAVVFELWGERVNDEHGTLGLLVSLGTFVVSSAIFFGSVFYAGFLDKVVGEHQHGHHWMPVGEIVRGLPYRRLILADIIVAFAVSVGLIVLVVPGLVIFSFLAIVGPLITIEDESVMGALRRSVRLIRPVFWTAFFAVTLPVILEHHLLHGIRHLVLHDPSFLTAFILTSLTTATVAAFVGLVEVTLAFALLHRDAALRSATDGEAVAESQPI
jgi:hypothetical protein